MVVLTIGRIRDFAAKHADASVPLNRWFDTCEAVMWANFQELKRTFNSTDSVGNDRYVFNIGGNNYRLVARIKFKTRTMFIRGIYTHAEYSGLTHNDLRNL